MHVCLFAHKAADAHLSADHSIELRVGPSVDRNFEDAYTSIVRKGRRQPTFIHEDELWPPVMAGRLLTLPLRFVDVQNNADDVAVRREDHRASHRRPTYLPWRHDLVADVIRRRLLRHGGVQVAGSTARFHVTSGVGGASRGGGVVSLGDETGVGSDICRRRSEIGNGVAGWRRAREIACAEVEQR